ncbi:MFS transporter [Paenibacillus sp. J2TS4]|nr:MFS transporter [Paenibacillus sp. J2TS4]
MIANQRNIGYVIAGLLLGILMAAMDNTIVAAAMGTIVSELGGVDKIVWVTSAYMVTTMAGTPVFGKLSDMYGRKRFFIFGMLVFLLGSVLCGTAQSIEQLSIYRAIQGIGGGALMPIAFTVVFDIFPAEKRGKITGLFGAVFGISSIFGPLLGAYITEYITWHWIFYINLPLGLVSLAFIYIFYHESLAHSKQKIDWWGASTLVAAVVSLMFALELGGQQYAWSSPVIIGLFAAFILFLAVFLYVETKAAEPIISFKMFKNRLFAASNAVALFYGSTFIVATIYIPIFVQGVFGGSASQSGLILMPMMIGSVVGSQTGGFLTIKTSYRNIMIFSGFCFVTGIFLLSTLSPEMARSMLTFFMIITGFGVGFSFSVLSMAAIHGFDMRQRGSATSTNAFMRSLGMTLGITIFGIIQRNKFANGLEEALGGAAGSAPINIQDPREMLSPEKRSLIPAELLDKMTDTLSSSIAQTFLWALVPAVLALIFVFTMTGERLQMSEKKAVQPAPKMR